MPLIQGLVDKQNTWKMFVMSSIYSSTLFFMAFAMRDLLDKWMGVKPGDTSTWSLLLTALGTFCAAFLSCVTLYFIFGYGSV